MLHLKPLKSIAAIIMLAVVMFTACKKDAFSEKDAIAAQTSLLQTKFNFDLMIKGIDLQIQRSKDSAAIAMIKLQYNADSSIERFKQSNAIASLLQNLQNSRLLAMQADSLSRNLQTFTDLLSRTRSLWNDSVEKAKSSSIIALALQKNYSLTFTDNITGQPLVGATVTVLPFGSSTFATTTTNAQGIARFTGLVVDPGAYFAISATGYGSALLREASLTSSTAISGDISIITRYNAAPTTLYNLSNTRNTIRGSILGDLNLTNGDATEAVVGQLVTFTTTITTTTASTIYQFAAVSDVNGNYSVSVPDGSYLPTFAATIRVQQKLFVNNWLDQDASTSLPRIDSTGTTLQLTTGVSTINAGTAQAFYLSFPSDTINPTKPVFAASTTTGNNTIYNPANFTGISGGVFLNRFTTPKTDTLGSFNFQQSTNIFFNNLVAASSTDNTVVYSRTNLYSPAKPTALLPVTLVSLIPGWIVSAPLLEAQVNGNTGKINNIVLKGAFTAPLFLPIATSGGVFNNAVMFTATGRAAYQNLTGVYPTSPYPASLANFIQTTNSSGTINASGGNSYFLPLEYRNAIARDRTPR